MGERRNLISMFEGYGATGPGAPGNGALQAPVGDAPSLRSFVFTSQSEIDPTYLDYGVRDQKAGQPIVQAQNAQDSGFGLGLAPWAETPIAVRFRAGGQQGGSAVFILRPGDVVFPSRSRPFSGFEWGLPFGWLGGGLATIAILPSPETDLGWGGTRREVLFHRFQTTIVPVAGLVNDAAFAAALRFNWPLRFPFVQQRRQDAVGTFDQSGQPLLSVEPTRIIFILHPTAGALGAAATMRALLFRPRDTTPAATFAQAEVVAEEHTWGGPWAQLGVPATYLQFPQIELTSGPLVRMGGDNAGVCGLLLVSDPGLILDNLRVDVLRYGLL